MADVIRRLEFLYGKEDVRKATVLEHLQRLFDVCIMDRRRFIIHPRSKRRGGNAFYRRRILDIYPVAASIIARTDKRKEAHNSFSEGKHEVYCRIDPSLDPDFVIRLKYEIARFYGFKR